MLKNYIAIAGLFAAQFLVADAFSADTLSGPVTQNDINSFKTGTKNLQPPKSVVHIDWAQGTTGETVKTFGVVYEISKDVDVLNKMLTYTDQMLALRNDKAPKGCKVWSGAKDPVWVDCNEAVNGVAGTGGEQGDYVGHLGYSARLILQNPAIWDKEVPDKDPFKNGRTYLLRAKTYIREAEYSMDKHVLKSLLDLSQQNRQYFAKNSPYKGGLPVPWNQQMMFNYALSNLALAHDILRDDAARATKYNALVQASIDWFFKEAKSYKTKKGNTAYKWTYSVSQPNDIEDNNHAHLDIEGFSRLYALGKYKLAVDQLKPFANTVVDVLIRGKGDYAGRMDGTDGSGNASPTTYLRSGNMLSAEWLPGSFDKFVIDVTPKNIPRIEIFARLLWLKNRINKTKFTPKK